MVTLQPVLACDVSVTKEIPLVRENTNTVTSVAVWELSLSNMQKCFSLILLFFPSLSTTLSCQPSSFCQAHFHPPVRLSTSHFLSTLSLPFSTSAQV